VLAVRFADSSERAGAGFGGILPRMKIFCHAPVGRSAALAGGFNPTHREQLVV